jgi:MoaA/NifB/PqqE/SkfB family radical SAM enzyme
MGLKRFYKYGKFALKKPQLVSRTLNNYFNLIFLRKNVLRKVEMGITFDCNATCERCSSHKMRDNNKKKLTTDEIKKVGQACIDLGMIQFNLTGGEPLLNKDIFEIIKAFQPKKTFITINTNGSLLTEALILKLRDEGVDKIKLSFDSPVAEEHDKLRGIPGLYNHLIKMLDVIKETKGIDAQLSTVVIRENVNHRIWDLIKLAEKYNTTLGLTIAARSGKWVNNPDVLLTDEQRNILPELIKHPRVLRDTEAGYLKARCPAGNEELYITCYGDIIPCPLVQLSFGNVKEKSLRSIWDKMTGFSEFKKARRMCLAAEDKDFINKYVEPIKEKKDFPVPIEKIS